EQLDERRLPRAIHTHQRNAISTLDGEVYIAENFFRPEALGHARAFHYSPSTRIRLRETEVDGLLFWRNLDALDLLQLLDAALHLFGLGRLIAEAVDECLELLDSLTLVLVGGYQRIPALLLLCQVFFVIAAVEVNALVPDLNSAIHGNVKQVAVM